MAAVEIAFARDAPMHGFDAPGRIDVIPLKRRKRLHGAFRLLHDAVLRHFFDDRFPFFTEGGNVHVLLAVAAQKLQERLLFHQERLLMLLFARHGADGEGQLFPAAERPGLLQSVVHGSSFRRKRNSIYLHYNKSCPKDVQRKTAFFQIILKKAVLYSVFIWVTFDGSARTGCPPSCWPRNRNSYIRPGTR